MINSIATPVDLKLCLIPILKHMHHDVNMVSKVKIAICPLLQKLEKYIYIYEYHFIVKVPSPFRICFYTMYVDFVFDHSAFRFSF